MRVAVANDFELVVAGLAGMLQPFADRVEVADALIVGRPVNTPVDLVLYDTFGRADRGMAALSELCNDPNVDRVAIYTAGPDHTIAEIALAGGAAAVLSKSAPADRLVDDLVRVAAGEVVVHEEVSDDVDYLGRDLGLSPRQAEIMGLVLEGLRNQEIADALFVEVNTVKTHLRKAYAVLGVRNRAEAAALLLRGRWFARRPRPAR